MRLRSHARTHTVALATVCACVAFTAFSSVASAATLADLFAGPRTDTSARLNARLDPEGTDTTYRFEYSQDGVNWTPAGEGDAGAGSEAVLVSAELKGLSPSTEYRFRVVAAGGGEVTQEAAFHTRTSVEVTPLQRGIELVNPPDKGNQNLKTDPLGDQEEAYEEENSLSADGNSVLWTTFAGGTPQGTTGAFNDYLATRGPTGWSSQSLVPPAALQIGEGNLHFNVPTVDAAASAGGADPNLAANRWVLVGNEGFFGVNYLYVVRGSIGGQQELLMKISQASSEFFTKSINASRDADHVFVINTSDGLVEDIGVSPPDVVSVLPAGETPPCSFTTSNLDFGGAFTRYANDWISEDGSRVYFGLCGHLYQRNLETGQTTKLANLAQRIRVSPDGRSILFLTNEALTGEDHNTHRDIYLWREGGSYRCLTCVVSDANVTSTVLASRDLQYVYFLSERHLTAGAGPVGANNLYVLRPDGSLDFVSTVEGPNPLIAYNARLTPDGKVLAFMTSTKPTSDQIAAGCNCSELYRYDAVQDSLECVSCSALGVTSYSALTYAHGLVVSDDGSTIAFLTEQPLSPRDINTAPDIYEWHDGVQQLITDGVRKFPSSGNFSTPEVRGIDATGSNILFSVVDPGLTGFEQDELSNIYVARVGGGFPLPPPPVHCEQESCQGPLQAPPPQADLSSAVYAGAGNLTPPTPSHSVKHHAHRKRVKHRARRHHAKRSNRPKGRNRKG